MKKCVLLLLACLLLTGMALAEENDLAAPRAGIACCAPQDGDAVPMFAIPDEQGEVLMNYYTGTQVEVLRIVDDRLVQVQVGEPGASLMGYMRAQDLAYGAKAARVTPWVHRSLIPQKGPIPLYSYFDEQSPGRGTLTSIAWIAVIGWREDGWMQVQGDSWLRNVYTGQERDYGRDAGFVKKQPGVSEELIRSTQRMAYPPMEDELSFEEAYETAVRFLVSGEHDPKGYFKRLPERFQSEEGLKSMRADVRIVQRDGQYVWWASFENPDNIDDNVRIYFTTQGDRVIEVAHTNG